MSTASPPAGRQPTPNDDRAEISPEIPHRRVQASALDRLEGLAFQCHRLLPVRPLGHVTNEGDAVKTPVVVEGQVLCGTVDSDAVVPEGDTSRLPFEAERVFVASG